AQEVVPEGRLPGQPVAAAARPVSDQPELEGGHGASDSVHAVAGRDRRRCDPGQEQCATERPAATADSSALRIVTPFGLSVRVVLHVSTDRATAGTPDRVTRPRERRQARSDRRAAIASSARSTGTRMWSWW